MCAFIGRGVYRCVHLLRKLCRCVNSLGEMYVC